jgi:hypothetical protein
MQIPASCWSVQERNRRRFWNSRFPFCLTSLPLSVAKPEVSKWRLREGYGRGCIPSAGGPGLCPRKNFQVTDACR